MTDTLSPTEIKKRSIKGAKWLLVMNGMGMPAAFLIALMLGRIGPGALGVYALAQIVIGVITTFVVYGGATEFSVFLPKLSCAEDRGRFLFSYALILLCMMTLTLGFFWLFPNAFEFLLQREFDMHNYGWFVLLAFGVVISETLVNTASGLMLVKTAAIARQMIRLVLLPLVVVLFFFKSKILIDHGLACILGGFLTGYILAAVICMTGIARDQRFQMQPEWLLPRGFWGLSLSTMAATIFTFLYNNFDRMAVLTINDVEGLGKYQAVISLSMLIGVVPKMLGTTLVPMFSSLLATGKKDAVRKAYDVLHKMGTILMTGLALFLISYSSELLSLFGDAYSSYNYLLSMFCVTAVITSPSFVNTPILITYEKNLFRFCVSAVLIFTQVLGTLIFTHSYGVLAIAGAKVVGLILAQSANIKRVTYGMKEGFHLPNTYKVGVIVALSCAIIRNGLLPAGWGISTAVFLSAGVCFCVVGRISVHDTGNVVGLMLRRKDKSFAFYVQGGDV